MVVPPCAAAPSKLALKAAGDTASARTAPMKAMMIPTMATPPFRTAAG
jgi:hypothetical protein